MTEEVMNQIYIKAWYGEWQAVGIETAKHFCKGLMYGMNCPDEDKKRSIEEYHLKGITFDELMAL